MAPWPSGADAASRTMWPGTMPRVATSVAMSGRKTARPAVDRPAVDIDQLPGDIACIRRQRKGGDTGHLGYLDSATGFASGAMPPAWGIARSEGCESRGRPIGRTRLQRIRDHGDRGPSDPEGRHALYQGGIPETACCQRPRKAHAAARDGENCPTFYSPSGRWDRFSPQPAEKHRDFREMAARRAAFPPFHETQ